MCRVSLKVLVLGLACLVAAPTLADTITYDMVTVVLTAVENGGAGRSKMVAIGGVDLP